MATKKSNFGFLTRFFSKRKEGNVLYAEALESLLKGDSDAAYRQLRDLVEIDTDHVAAYIRLGDILRDKERPDQAAKIHQSLTFRKRLSNDQKIEIFTSLAKDYYSSGHYSRAEENANRVIQLDRKNRWAVEYLIKICEEQERWLDATDYLKKYEKLTGGNGLRRRAFHRMMEGRSKERDGKTDDARSDYRKATKIDSTYADPYLYLGNLDEHEGNLKGAVENWMNFAKLSPSSGKQVFPRLEKSLFELGRFGEVEEFYKHLLKKDARNREVLWAVVNVLQAKGELDEALEIIEKALLSDDASVVARLARLRVLLKRHDQQDLSDEVDEIVGLLRGNASPHKSSAR